MSPAADPLATDGTSQPPPDLSLINLPEQLLELRELTRLLVYYKRLTQEQPDGRDAQGEVWGRGWSAWALQGPLSPQSPVLTSLEAL